MKTFYYIIVLIIGIIGKAHSQNELPNYVINDFVNSLISICERNDQGSDNSKMQLKEILNTAPLKNVCDDILELKDNKIECELAFEKFCKHFGSSSDNIRFYLRWFNVPVKSSGILADYIFNKYGNEYISKTKQDTIISEKSPLNFEEQLGSVKGKINFPGEGGMPSLKVIIKNTKTNLKYTITTKVGENTYQIRNIPGGTYIAYAYHKLNNYGNLKFKNSFAGYTQFVLDGKKDHSIIEFKVIERIETDNINILDWYGVVIPNEDPNKDN